MRIMQAVKDAGSNVTRSKLRTLLTMLGLIVGISSVIALVGLGQGSNQQVEDQMKSLGGDILTTYLYKGDLTYEDIEGMRNPALMSAVSPAKTIEGKVSYQKKVSDRAMVEATDEEYLNARNLTIALGRNISSVDRENRSDVCVLGPSVAQDLFGSSDVVGRKIKVAGRELTIVGVLENQGETIGMPTNDLVIIPFTLSPSLGGNQKVKTFYARANGYDLVTPAKIYLKGSLQGDKGLDPTSFNVGSLDEMLGAEQEVNATMTMMLAGIASISLVVAGIGVMNVMLVSVTERIREIGIKKALGARRSDILVQFLVEALIISLAGGALGVVAGLVFGLFADSGGLHFESSPILIGIAVVASVVVGLVFGIFPAYRASRLNPLDALRHE